MLFCPELIGFCFVFHKRLKTYISPEGGDLEWIRPLVSHFLDILGIVHDPSRSIVKNSLDKHKCKQILQNRFCLLHNICRPL